VRLVFERATELPQLFSDFAVLAPYPATPWGRTHPRLDPTDDRWADLATHVALDRWIQTAADHDIVGRVYQTRGTERVERLEALRREAISTVNDLLARLDAYDAERVSIEVELFWEDISADEERYEVGTTIYSVVAPNDMPIVSLGPGVVLRSIKGDWARERFSQPDRIPEGTVALSISTTWQRRYLHSFGSFESRHLIDRALLGLQLVRPRWHSNGSVYRIKTKPMPG